MCSKSTSERLRKCLNHHKEKPNSVIKAVARCFVPTIVIIVVLSLINVVGEMISPYLLEQMIDFIDSGKKQPITDQIYKGSILMIAMVLVDTCTTFLMTNIDYQTSVIGGQSIAALDTLIYEKVLKLSSKSCKAFTQGKFMNLLQNDCIKVANIMSGIADGVDLIATFIMSIMMLFNFLGFVAIGGVCICVISIIVNYILVRIANNYQDRTMKLKDERIRKTTEAFQYIRILKMYGLADLFHQIIGDARKKEVNATQRRRCISGFLTAALYLLPKLISVGTFVIYATFYEHISLGVVFATISVFNTISTPIRLIPLWINAIIDCYISNKRLNEFLECEEVPGIYKELSKDMEDTLAIEINGCDFTWTELKKSKLDNNILDKNKDIVININSSVIEDHKNETIKKKEHELPLLDKQRKTSETPDKSSQDNNDSHKNKPIHLSPMHYSPSVIPSSRSNDELAPLRNDGRSPSSGTPLVSSNKSSENENQEITSPQNVKGISEETKIHANSEKNKQKPDYNDKELIPLKEDEKSKSENNFELRKIKLKVKRAELVFIIGEIGSGKSSLLQALMGELKMSLSDDITNNLEVIGEELNPLSEKSQKELQSNLINKAGNFAYVEQQPWMQNATIRDNITFISEFEDKKYHETIKLCELEEDFFMLPAGDLTEIGERGINISGGQKARISLARAVYSDQDIYLLDDPLSALDTTVKRKIFYNCIMKKLADKTRIIASNCMDFLDEADRILVLDKGQIVFDGNYQEYINQDKFVSSINKIGPKVRESHISENALDSSLSENIDLDENSKISSGKIISQEGHVTTGVSFSVYKRYFNALGGPKFFILLSIVMASWVACATIGDYLLGKWADTELNDNQGNLYLIMNFLLALGTVFFYAMRKLVSYIYSMRASKKLHKNMLTKILNAPVNLFFDVTPLGRLINRMSNDLETVDIEIPTDIENIFVGFWNLIGALVITIILVYWSLLPIPFCAIAFIYYLRSYLSLQRNFSRLEKVSRSPIMLYGEELYRGASTVRAYQAQGKCISKAHKLFDNYLKWHIHIAGLKGWADLRMQIVSIIMNAMTLIFVVFLISKSQK